MEKSVRFLPDNTTVTVKKGDNLLNIAATAGVYINAFCGGDGVCGKCKVKIEEGEVTADQAMRLKKEDKEQGFQLACQSRVLTDLVVRVPDETEGKDGRVFKRKPKTTRSISARSMAPLIGTWDVDPPVEKRFLELPQPNLEDNIPDLQRLIRAIRKSCHDCKEPSYDHPELLQELPFVLREKNWQVTTILLRGKLAEEPDRIIGVEPGDTTTALYGLAVDIGTTTICGALIDLNSGKIIAEASSYNEQIRYGEDVISRIVYSQRPGGLKALQERVIHTLNNVIDSVCKKVIISPSDISYIMAAGNTTMSHLLLGINPNIEPVRFRAGEDQLVPVPGIRTTAHPVPDKK